MKNVDVPLWDKGDDTDSFAKGGSSGPSFKMPQKGATDKTVIKLFKLVLGREPSSRESTFYKYSPLKKEEIIKKLLETDEHKEILDKANKLPTVKEDLKNAKSTILKLKSLIKDKENEFTELKKLLEEKNDTIEELREEKDSPFLTNKEILDEQNIHYSITKPKNNEEGKKEKNFWDRLLYLFFGDSL